MISIRYLKSRIKDVNFKDMIAFLPMSVAFVLQPLFRKGYRDTWVVCERELEARDNGYWFYKYVCDNHPEQKIIYAISPKSPDYDKVCKLGNVINYGGLMHWILYFVCDKYISSQKSGKPNAAVCAFLELNGISKTRLVFLQHGIIINDVGWLYSDKCTFSMFITSTIPETEYIKHQFNYGDEVVKLTGLPRFDRLHGSNVKKNRILIMPTWRDWFRFTSKRETDKDFDFKSSEYLFRWKSFLNNDKLAIMKTEYNLEIIFYPHSEMQPYLDCFEDVCDGVILASREKNDIQELLKSSQLLITDYSSVFFDMVYMKKPVLFYQFDEKKYRRSQYAKGYFDYFNNPFGQCYTEETSIIEALENCIKSNYSISDEYVEEHKKIFKYYDTDNCRRVYAEIQRISAK